MTDVQAIKENWGERRKPERLIYLGNHARPYGVSEPDTWGMDTYFAAAIANGLRMLVAYGHCVRDEAEYERIAGYLEFYGNCPEDALFRNIDWSRDDENIPLTDENGYWISPAGQPGFDEYCEKSAVIDEVRLQYMKKTMTLVGDHWGDLWD